MFLFLFRIWIVLDTIDYKHSLLDNDATVRLTATNITFIVSNRTENYFIEKNGHAESIIK